VCSCSVVAIFHGPQPPYLIGSLHSLFSLHWSLNLPYLPSDNDCCSRNVCGASRPFDIKILDNNQREVMHLSRPLRCSTCWCPCFLQVTYIDTWSMAPTPYCVFHTNTAGGQPCPLYGVRNICFLYHTFLSSSMGRITPGSTTNLQHHHFSIEV